MIKLVKIDIAGPDCLTLTFSDGSIARWCAREIIARNTELTRPLADPTYFARAFIESGALAWPNGLELAPWALYRQLDEAGLLIRKAA